MTTSRFSQILRSLCASLAVLATGTAMADGASYYYDGARKVTISQVPYLAADFAGTASGPQASLAPGVSRVAGDSVVRIYRMPASPLNTPDAGATSSLTPVFVRGQAASGRLMALPGGVLVKFKPDWTREQVDAWVAARGFAKARAMDFGKNWFRIDTLPGAASLQAANVIFESGDVLAASPNWWMQTSAK